MRKDEEKLLEQIFIYKDVTRMFIKILVRLGTFEIIICPLI